MVFRPRLLERLDEGSPLTVIRGPLGFGKTTLATQWFEGLHGRSPGLAAWVTVDHDSADAAGFWQNVLDVLTDAGLEPPAPEPTRPARLQVHRAVAAAGCEMVLVVDAFERVTGDGIDGDLLDLVRVSPNLRLVVSLRSHRHFQPHSYLDLDFTVIPPAELLLTVEETAALLDDFCVTDLSDERVRAMHADGGGWVEPTRALAIALCTSSAAVLDPPSDQDLATQVALGYLRQRILPAIDDESAEFALATSLVDGVSTELAELLSDGPVAKAHLQPLEADGVLYSTVEDGETVYRWPPAVRRAMAAELQARTPERARQLHARIAHLYATRHRPEVALRHALDAGDWQLVVQIIERFWRSLLVAHRDILYAALSAAPLDLLETSPRALAVRDLRLQAPDDRVLAAIPDLPADPDLLAQLGASPQVADILDTGMVMLIALCRRGHFSRARDLSERLEAVAGTARVARTAETASQLPGLLARVGVVHLLADNLPGAYRPLKAAYENAADSPFDYIRREAAGELAFAFALTGDLPHAEIWLRRHDHAPLEQGWLRRLASSAAVAARVLITLERLDTDQATAIAATTLDELGTDESWAFTVYARSLLALHTGDALGGLRQLDEARAAYPTWHDQGSTAQLLLARVEADLLLALGRANQTRAVLRTSDPSHPSLQVPRARLELLAGHPKTALALATDLTWIRSADPRAQLEMLLMQAVAHHRLGQTDPAAGALGRALSAAQATESLRPFTTVARAELTAIADRLPADTIAVLETPVLRAAPDVFPDHVQLIELTRREQTVLDQIAQGLLVQQIADQLYVSSSTVKTHLKALYHKLNVTSRGEAVARGRQLGFLTEP